MTCGTGLGPSTYNSINMSYASELNIFTTRFSNLGWNAVSGRSRSSDTAECFALLVGAITRVTFGWQHLNWNV
jgi:hypothetical protein